MMEEGLPAELKDFMQVLSRSQTETERERLRRLQRDHCDEAQLQHPGPTSSVSHSSQAPAVPSSLLHHPASLELGSAHPTTAKLRIFESSEEAAIHWGWWVPFNNFGHQPPRRKSTRAAGI